MLCCAEFEFQTSVPDRVDVPEFEMQTLFCGLVRVFLIKQTLYCYFLFECS